MPPCRPRSGRYGAVIEPLSLDHHAFTEVLARPDAPDQIREAGEHTLLLVDGDGELDPAGLGRLMTLPAVVVSTSPTDAPPAWADTVAREAETVDRIMTSVSTNPLASVAFASADALLGRSRRGRGIGRGVDHLLDAPGRPRVRSVAIEPAGDRATTAVTCSSSGTCTDCS